MKRKGQRKLEKLAEEETTHIDEMLEYKSGVNQLKSKLGRKSRHQQTAKIAKLTRLETKIKRDARKKAERKWETNGMTSVIAYSSLQQLADGAPIEKTRSPTNSLKQMLMKVWANLFWDPVLWEAE